MGKYQIDAALNIAVSSEAQSAVSDLGALIKQQSDAQIQQNKLIAQVLKEVTSARKQDIVVQKEETVRTRDNTKQMNLLAAASYKLRSTLYNQVGVIRNLGAMITKTLTVLVPWYNMIMMVYNAIKDFGTYLGWINPEVEELNETLKDISDIKIPDFNKMLFPAGVAQPLSDLKQIVKEFGSFYQTEDIVKILPENELKVYDDQLKQFNERYAEAYHNVAQIGTKYDDLNKKVTILNQQVDEEKLRESELLKIFEGNIHMQQLIKEETEGRVSLIKEELLPAERELVTVGLEYQQMVDLLGPKGKELLLELQYYKKNLEAITGSGKKGKDKKDPAKKTAEEFIKDQIDDLKVFLEYYQKSLIPETQAWYEKILQAGEDMKRQIGKYIHTDIGRAYAMDMIAAGTENALNKALKVRREEYDKLLEKVFPKEDTYLKERTKALEKPLEYIRDKTNREMGYNLMPLAHISDEDKAKIEKQIQENVDWYQDRMATISQERAKKLETLANRRKEFEAFDIAGLGISPEERLAQLKQFQDEELQIKLDALNEEERVKEEYAERDKKRREAEVTAFGNIFRLIDKNSLAWKQSDDAMNTMISALDMLGISGKKVFAMQNYAKGIEASVDAINCQADALIQFGLGDVKGGLALQAAAIAKGVAAVAYFKNSTEMGGKGGTAPSVGTSQVVGSDNKERNITINMAFEGTAGAIIGPLADAFNQQASVPGGVRLNSNLIRR
jgi:hypothetical protein